MNAPIRTDKLGKTFGSNRVLDGLDLTVEEGSIYALIGSNGAGKTTTIKILMNIHEATSGRAELLGVDSRRLKPAQLARIGYVSENQKLPEWMTVAGLLEYCRPFYPTWDTQLAADLTKQFRLPAKRKLRDLSRGMRMKAALASSLAYRPAAIVLDEPFGGLDPLARDEFIEGLLEWAPGATILISSHDLADIESFASHIGFLDEGRLLFSEETSALTQRFREVEIVLDGEARLPERLPASWLRPQAASAVVRFVETRYDGTRTDAEIREMFAGIRRVAAEPMPLRSIFVALARSARTAA
ncbi:MAG: ABC transporter ATP-binding protein [Bryobacteraceae bacterium]